VLAANGLKDKEKSSGSGYGVYDQDQE
jgi:hypothetical protein